MILEIHSMYCFRDIGKLMFSVTILQQVICTFDLSIGFLVGVNSDLFWGNIYGIIVRKCIPRLFEMHNGQTISSDVWAQSYPPISQPPP